MKRIPAVLTALLCLTFFSCVTTKTDSVPYVYITNSKKINLLPPEFIEEETEEIRLFEGTFGENSFSMPVYVKADKSGIFMQVLNDFGTSMAELSYDGMKVTFDSTVFPKEFRAEYIIADFQLAYYDFEKIKETLNDVSLDFTVHAETSYKEFSESTVRSASAGEKIIAEFIENTEKKTMTVRNHLWKYEYTLTGVSYE